MHSKKDTIPSLKLLSHDWKVERLSNSNNQIIDQRHLRIPSPSGRYYTTTYRQSYNNASRNISDPPPRDSLTSKIKESETKEYPRKKQASYIRKTAPVGILPAIYETQRQIDHWLPGSLNLSTSITLQKPFQFVTRKRRVFPVIDKDAAGFAKTCVEFHRFHNKPLKRGRLSPMMTVTSAI